MHTVDMNMYASAGVGVLALLLGMVLTRFIPALKRFCIPAPVTGGLIFSLLTLLLYYVWGVECTFDGTIKDICMMLFFTSVGFQCDLFAIRKGGRLMVIMVILVAVLIAAQNFISVGIAKGLGLSPLLGMAAGSIPMCGGHGTSGGFSPLLEQMGLQGASSITMAAATFGLVAGSLIGGPLAEMLIRRLRLANQSSGDDVMKGVEAIEAGIHDKTDISKEKAFREYLTATCQLLIAMALGSGLSYLLAKTGITFPTYFGALLAAFAMRNLLGLSPRLAQGLCVGRIISIGDICLLLFLGMAMASLRLWELASMALPLLLILTCQMAFIAIYAAFVAFPVMGKSYDSAVLVSGLVGFGLGATPNAMANMSAVCLKYRYAAVPFIIVPIIGAMFVDLINTGIITIFLNLIH